MNENVKFQFISFPKIRLDLKNSDFCVISVSHCMHLLLDQCYISHISRFLPYNNIKSVTFFSLAIFPLLL